MSRRGWILLALLTVFSTMGIPGSPARSAPLPLWALFASPPPTSSALQFTIADLGTLGGGSSTARCVNDLAQVAGSSLTTGGVEHAFLFSDGKLIDLGTQRDTSSTAWGINNQGHVVGQFLTAPHGSQHAFLYSGGKMVDLGTLGGLSSAAAGINDSDQATGYSFTSVQGYSLITGIVATHTFVYSGGRMSDLGTLGGATSAGSGINAAGQVVGSSFTTNNAARHAILYSEGRRIDLGTLGGLNSFGNGINALGQVVGNSFVSGNSAFRAFLWTGGSMVSLNTLGGANSSANGINALGQIAGESDAAPGVQHAFLWQEGELIDLNTRIPSGSGWELSRALSVSDGGEIAGEGLRNGETHAFLLTPADAKTLTLQEANDARNAVDELLAQVSAGTSAAQTVPPRVSYLISKLQAARERIARGNGAVALNLLQSFSLVASSLTASEMPAGKRQALVDGAQGLINQLGG